MEGSLDTGLWLDAENYQISIGLAVSTRSEGGDRPPRQSTSDRLALRGKELAACADQIRDAAARKASPHRDDGQPRPVPGTARHHGPVV